MKVWTRHDAPVDWANTKREQGENIKGIHDDYISRGKESQYLGLPKKQLMEVIDDFREAAEVYKEVGLTSDLSYCERQIGLLEADLDKT